MRFCTTRGFTQSLKPPLGASGTPVCHTACIAHRISRSLYSLPQTRNRFRPSENNYCNASIHKRTRDNNRCDCFRNHEPIHASPPYTQTISPNGRDNARINATMRHITIDQRHRVHTEIKRTPSKTTPEHARAIGELT